MKKRMLALLLALLLLAGCGGGASAAAGIPNAPAPTVEVHLITDAPATEPPAAGAETEAPGPAAETLPPETETPETEAVASPPPAETPYPDPTPSPPAVEEDGEYTSETDVAAYINAFGHLPPNFITKREARALGWPGGDLWAYAPGKSIGGDFFGNYEGLLPKGNYHECDVNYSGGSRGAERLIYGNDGSVYYTNDHYASFTQLY